MYAACAYAINTVYCFVATLYACIAGFCCVTAAVPPTIDDDADDKK